MAKKSAGLLLFRHRRSEVEVLLAHPGGPFWAKKDDGAWSIPKGQLDDDEDPLAAAVRECHEELGVLVTGDFVPLAPIRQPGGKLVLAWAQEGDFEPQTLVSNTFELEWPPRSGRLQLFPEVDRAGWFSMDEARIKLLEAQRPLLDQLTSYIAS
ncbi:MAG: NUDIX domain-containing protein [Steroidobacteraceae bacterium]